jgi:multidrug efflux pump subunit AcrA (membrane-fusion protein)
LCLAGSAGAYFGLPARDLQTPAAARPAEPEAAVVSAPFGGWIQEVLAAPGEHVTTGQLLLRLGNPEVDTQVRRAQTALRQVPPRFVDAASSLLHRVPGPLWRDLVQTDPELRAAEQEYADALAAFERDAGPAAKTRLTAAEKRRMEAQRRVGELRPERLAAVSDLYRQNLATLRWIERQRRLGEVRSPVNGKVELIDLKAGDRVDPFAPLALIAKEP